ncbi:hypothetical protein PS15m_000086 [Mucor circinelloides]
MLFLKAPSTDCRIVICLLQILTSARAGQGIPHPHSPQLHRRQEEMIETSFKGYRSLSKGYTKDY